MSSIVKVDTIQENTSANGITIDGLNIKDSKLVTSNSVVTANITDGAVSAAKLASGVGESNTPYFRAYNNTNSGANFSSSTTTVARLNATNFDSGSGFNTSTYKYTIPSNSAGKYFFHTNMRLNNNYTNAYFAIYFFKNGSEHSFASNYYDDFSANPIVEHSSIVDMSVGDTMEVRLNTNGGSPELDGNGTARYSFFEGFKISS